MGFYVGWLVDAARMAVAGTGKQVIVSPGWQSRGQGGLRVLEVVVGHHTATPETAPGDYPSLNVVQNGRAGLIGLLSQLGLGRSGNIYVIGAGLAYHAGASAFAGYYDLNDESIGIEAEDSGDGRWTDAELFMYPRLVGACLYYIRRGPDRYASHRTVAVPAGRKNDPAGISDQWMRQQVAIPPQPVQQETEVALRDDPDGFALIERVSAFIAGQETVQKSARAGDEVWPVKRIKAMDLELDDLRNQVAGMASGVGDAVKTAVEEYLLAHPLTVDVDYAALAKAVNDDAARRLAE
jgi:hypothetical protein